MQELVEFEFVEQVEQVQLVEAVDANFGVGNFASGKGFWVR